MLLFNHNQYIYKNNYFKNVDCEKLALGLLAGRREPTAKLFSFDLCDDATSSQTKIMGLESCERCSVIKLGLKRIYEIKVP